MQIPVIYNSPLLPFLKIKDIELHIYKDDENFSPEVNYSVYCIQDCNQYFRISKDDKKPKCEVYAENNKGIITKSFDLIYKPPKIKEVIKEVKVPIKSVIESNDTVNNQFDEPYLNGAHDMEINKNTDMHTFVNLLSQGISSNCSIRIDYSEVNLTAIGTYKVIYYYGNQQIKINVTVK